MCQRQTFVRRSMYRPNTKQAVKLTALGYLAKLVAQSRQRGPYEPSRRTVQPTLACDEHRLTCRRFPEVRMSSRAAPDKARVPAHLREVAAFT